MENKLEKIGQNNFMDNFVKTDDILKDMCGIIESSQKAAYRAVNTTLIQRNWLLGYRIASEELHKSRTDFLCVPTFMVRTFLFLGAFSVFSFFLNIFQVLSIV